MKVQIAISGQVEIDDGDLERLTKETPSTLASILQDSGKNVKTRVAELYVKKQEKE